MTPLLFASALFASAALLFAVQPMAGKDLLPLAGGTPAVWTTCLVFFQAVLLLGYLYADRLTSIRAGGKQAAVHLLVGAAGLAAAVWLRPNPDWIPDDADYPTLGLAAYLAALVGLPFFALSATAPLLQHWFARSGHRRAADPYFLYAASNAGSFVGLLAYPFAVEPLLALSDQRGAWAAGYAGLLALVAACALAGRNAPSQPLARGGEGEPAARSEESLSSFRQFRWLALAALPSSLLMSVTAHLTTDVAPVPLLWVVPLGLYLLTFVVAFARWTDRARRVAGRVVPMLLVFLAVALLTAATEPPGLVAAVHLVAFTGVALLCHGELAADRPGKEHLTRFYLVVSAGGVAGGLFNALVAPVLFARLGLLEYPLGVVLAGLVRPKSDEPARFTKGDAAFVLGLAALAVGLVLAVPPVVEKVWPTAGGDAGNVVVSRVVRSGLAYGVPAMVAFALVARPVRFALCLAVLFAAGRLDPGVYGDTRLTTRNFFGTLRVTNSPDGRYVRLVHGTTMHGQQRADEPRSPQPLMYYHRKGPVGRLFRTLPPERKRRVAVIGLGCGAMAAYGEPGQAWAFYEIDPAVVRIAADPDYFTFLKDCRADWRVVVGDARRQLEREPDGAFDLIALDAFSSDAIPVHLLTAEAFALYARKLAPGGVLTFHLSNRYLDLPPMVARVAAANDPPFACRLADDRLPADADGRFPSTWAVLARDPADLGPAEADAFWAKLPPTPGPVWRDDFSNLLAVWRRTER